MTLYSDTEPLTWDEVADFVEEGYVDDLILVDGVFYCFPDMWHCAGCSLAFASRAELDDSFDETLCEDCKAEWEEDARYEREKWDDWRRWQ